MILLAVFIFLTYSILTFLSPRGKKCNEISYHKVLNCLYRSFKFQL